MSVGNAQAETPLKPDYVGLNLLSVHSDERSSDFQKELDALALNATVTQSDLKRNGWSIYAGYRMQGNAALEFGYADLGDVSTTITGQALDVNSFITDVKNVYPSTASGLTADIVHRLPVKTGIDAFIRGGVFLWKEDYTLHGNGVSKSFSDSGLGIRLGAAMEMAFNESWAGRFGWSMYRFSGARVDTWELGVSYRY
jgi:opacity protein-like surface antigen